MNQLLVHLRARSAGQGGSDLNSYPERLNPARSSRRGLFMSRASPPAPQRSLLEVLKTLKPLEESFPDIPELPTEPVNL